jgi:hypothetical protein
MVLRQQSLMVLCLTVGLSALNPLLAEDVTWSMDSLSQIVQPMRHSMEGRIPLMCWNLPLPADEKLVEMQGDGSLRKAIETLAERGIVPTVVMGWNWDPAGALAMAQTLQEAGQPVYVLAAFGIVDGEKALYAESPKFTGPWPWDETGQVTWKGTRDWPCLPVYDVSQSVAFYREWMQRFKNAGITVDAVWTDYEGLPYAWNFIYESQKQAECAKHYPPGALDSWHSFASYVGELRARILQEAIADPVHEFFPQALVSNYGSAASSEAYPFVGSVGAVSPPCTIGHLSAVMPSVYAGGRHLGRYYNMDWPVTQAEADNIYFTTLLSTISTSMANKGTKLGIPYVCRYLPTSEESRYDLGMSAGVYREMLRHAFLRGTDGLYLFNLGFPGSRVTPQESFESVEDARSVMDEMLTFREFLEQGQPMNFDLPAMRTYGIVWSGLALPDRVLVRVFTFGPETRTLDLIPFPGVAVKLEATNRGATYLVDRAGRARVVRRGLL